MKAKLKAEQQLAAANFRPDLIVVDTLVRVAVGMDENSARDMGEIVAAAEALRRSFDASILLIHHTRKDGNSERGSSALRGAADLMIECKWSSEFENIVTLTCSKMKDDEPFADIEIGLEKVDVGGGRTSLVAGPAPSILQRTLRSAGLGQRLIEDLYPRWHCKNRGRLGQGWSPSTR
jgi:hypothetical protein